MAAQPVEVEEDPVNRKRQGANHQYGRQQEEGHQVKVRFDVPFDSRAVVSQVRNFTGNQWKRRLRDGHGQRDDHRGDLVGVGREDGVGVLGLDGGEV